MFGSLDVYYIWKPGWRKLLPYVGPGFLVSLAYLGPRNCKHLGNRFASRSQPWIYTMCKEIQPKKKRISGGHV
ncbi:hypothetical protein POTOM_061250 [Populus tomentosa]|uniref:Uncharacterized protein n=1 Tax=Populus tomentosa TaxID=118781 RepID=A0A8X8BYH1_POPTO|nr:hypothetical protein POTOM_061250 [Populus tomentosa]